MSNTAQIESRLFAGERLIKTMDPDSSSGACWAFEDGRTAGADLCERMLASGVLLAMHDGLFEDVSQSHVLAPFAGSLSDFITERHGGNWCVAKRRTQKLREKYDTIILPREYAAAEREWTARHALTERRAAA